MARRLGSRMFDAVTKTWNPVITFPCQHQCVYCWVPRVVARFWSSPAMRYYRESRGMPLLIEERLYQEFSHRDLVFVCDTSDLMGSWVPREMILAVLRAIARKRGTFLILTKNPARFLAFVEEIPRTKVLCGATIETDRDDIYVKHSVSRAPLPSARIAAMRMVRGRGLRTFVSVEPIIDFSSPRIFGEIIAGIEPELVYIGYDNYGALREHSIPEPGMEKTLELADVLRQHGIEVRLKTIRRAWNEP